ncbi:MAG: serine hydrolase, partial [Proteobacteria bacterium]|nr:serine hydrolase [Pseudomonadota bacterium]
QGISQEKEMISIHHLLTHTSGLPAWSDLFSPDFDRKQGLYKLLNIPLEHPVGSRMVYSCLDFLLLGEIVRRLSGGSLADYCAENIFKPLELKNTGFNPSVADQRIIETDDCPHRKKRLRGTVHDENAFLFGGEGGNAGLFSTAEEVHKLCGLIFKKGRAGNHQVISEQSINLLLKNHNNGDLTPHSLGWDYNPKRAFYRSCGNLMPVGSLGHLGFTGTSLWIQPDSGISIIILTNRIYYGRDHKMEEMRKLRPELHNLLYSMIDSRPLTA